MSSTSHQYLHPSVATFRVAYLYQSRLGNRGVLGLFLPHGGSAKEDMERLEHGSDESDDASEVHARALVWYVNPFKGGDRISLSRIFDRIHGEDASTCRSVDCIDSM